MRDIAHIIIGFAFVYFCTYFGNLGFAGHLCIGTALGLLLGLLWEVFQEHMNRINKHYSKFDWMDVLRTGVIGGSLGGITQNYTESSVATWAAFGVCLFALAYVVVNLKNKRAI